MSRVVQVRTTDDEVARLRELVRSQRAAIIALSAEVRELKSENVDLANDLRRCIDGRAL